MLVTLKINGLELVADTDKMHETWIEKCLAYGVRRLPNDSFSGEKGETKHELVKGLLQDMMSGEPAPVRVKGSGTSSLDPVTALARKNAKADLTGMFRAVTGKTKALDFLGHEKCAPFFISGEKEGGELFARWNEETVTAWMAKQAEAGKRDYQADAQATIDAATNAEADLDF